MTDVRVKIGSVDLSLPVAVVDVVWDSVTAYKPDQDSRTYLQEFKSDMILRCQSLPDTWPGETPGERFDNLVSYESGCSVFEVSVEVYCDGSWTEVWDGVFDTSNWRSDRDQKTIAVRPKQQSAFNCIKNNWGKQVNIFAVTPVTITRPYNAILEFLTVVEDPCDPNNPNPDGNPTNPHFCYSGQVSVLDFGGVYKCGWIFQRYLKAGTCNGVTPVAPDDYNGWQLHSGGCPGTPVFWLCPESARLVYSFKNGRRFDEVLQYLLDQTGCGLTVVSDFFNINPDNTAPSNSAYDRAADVLQDLIIHQKSDVKRHDATEVSKEAVWLMKLRDLLSDLVQMFKVAWRIDGTEFRLEHVSYFEAQAGPDYTAESYEKVLTGGDESVPLIKRFQFRDEQCSDYFKGYPIETYCGEGEATVRLALFSTDLAFMAEADNAESIGDDGWVLIAATPGVFANQYENIEDNRPLSWTELHEYFHAWEMDGAGKINDADATPQSLRKTRKAPAFGVRLCCDEAFDPSTLVTTAMGDGELEEAERNWSANTLTLTLKY